MPGPLVQVGSTILCTHAGQVTPTAPSPRVTLSGAPAVTLADVSTVAGCPFNVSGSPVPCVTVSWLVGTTRVLVGGVPALIQTSTGICAPNGTPPTIAVTQMRVIGT